LGKQLLKKAALLLLFLSIAQTLPYNKQFTGHLHPNALQPFAKVLHSIGSHGSRHVQLHPGCLLLHSVMQRELPVTPQVNVI
jgi:hypothetical protein